MCFPFLILLKIHIFMYGYFSIRTPSEHSRNESHSFQSLLNQKLNHRYQILKYLGQSSFGQTFLAVDEQQNSLACMIRQVIIRNDTNDYQISLERFHREVKQLAELGKHPQIPELFDTFNYNGYAFIVQEWIDGWTLEQEIADGVPFDEVEVRKVLRELLPVLQYLHDRQIIHLDIKPENIIRRASDRALVLVNFGVTRHITIPNLPQSGTMIGSVEYAAPEQIKGQAVFASDLYSMGLICLHLLTQMRPFDLYDIVENDWKWHAYLPHPISSDLKAVLCKLLQPAVRRRYHSASEVLIDLQTSTMLVADQTADHETQTPSFFALRLEGTLNIHPVKEAPLFAEEIAAIKALSLMQRVLIISIGAVTGSTAAACLVFCLGIILFALNPPPHPSASPQGNHPVVVNSFRALKP